MYKLKKHFAWLPTIMSNGHGIWFLSYFTISRGEINILLTTSEDKAKDMLKRWNNH